MTIQTLVNSFVSDKQTQVVLALIAADLILGVAAGLKMGAFNLQYVANFARNDVLSKVLPFFALHTMAVVAGGTNLVIPGFDVNAAATSVFALVTAALAGSLISSLDDLVPGFKPPVAIGGRGATPPAV